MSIVLDGGSEYAGDRSVSVQLNAPGQVIYVELSEDPVFAGAVVEPFAPFMAFELSQGDGLKTVYARLTFADGTVAGEIVSDDIVLDTQATTDSVSFSPTGQIFSAGDSIAFFLAAHQIPFIDGDDESASFLRHKIRNL